MCELVSKKYKLGGFFSLQLDPHPSISSLFDEGLEDLIACRQHQREEENAGGSR